MSSSAGLSPERVELAAGLPDASDLSRAHGGDGSAVVSVRRPTATDTESATVVSIKRRSRVKTPATQTPECG